MKNNLLKKLLAGFVVMLLLPMSVMAQVNGEFRSLATGIWGAAGSWEIYSTATSGWTTSTVIPTGATAIVTIRTGHTITLTTTPGIKKLTIQSGGSLIADGASGEKRLDFSADTSVIINNGNFGGIAGSNESKLNLANALGCKMATITGTGTTSIARIRFVASSATVTNSSVLNIDQDLTVTSSGITAWNNATTSNIAENSVITINAGKTVTLVGSGPLHNSTTPTPVNPGGTYTYNINGTLDMSSTTGYTYMYPMNDPSGNSLVTINVAGVWKVNRLDAAYTGTNLGKVALNILPGGLVDASRATVFNMGSKYFVVSGNGKLKRAIKTTSVDTFAIGTSSTSFNPVYATGTTQTDTISVGVSNSLIAPIGDPTKIVAKQWDITPVGTGSGLTASFGWQTADQAAAFNQANPLSIFRYSGTTWAAVSNAATITGSGTTTAPYTTGASVAPATLSGQYVVGNSDAQVVVVPTVTIAATPGTTVCSGINVTFTATTTNITGAHYQWKVNGVNAGTDAATFASTTLATGNIVTCVISYTVGGPAAATSNAITMTINPAPNVGSITGSPSVCSGTTTQLVDAATGGTWSSSNNLFATVSTTGLVSGVAVGSVTISYTVTNSCGTAVATFPMAVTLGASAGTISGGTTSLCPTTTTTLTSNSPGGAWSSNNAAVATVSTTGLVTGVAGGTATIAYIVTNGCGTDTAKKVITVNSLPVVAAIGGPTTVCTGSTITLTDATPSGVWTSNNSNATISSTGVVTGVNVGASIITYKVTNTCGFTSVTYNVAIATVPVVKSITGATTVCAGSTITLADSTVGGVWSNANAGISSISTTGVVTGIAAGADVITYSLTNACGSASSTKNITVGALPTAVTINGSDSVCITHNVTLTPGATTDTARWSSATGKTAISTDGIVTGISLGVDTVVYTITNACGSVRSTFVITVWNCDPTGIKNVGRETLTAVVYPNPNNGAFTCMFPSSKNEEVKIVLTNMMGAVIATKTAKTNERIIFEVKQAAGVYFLNAATENGRSATKINITE